MTASPSAVSPRQPAQSPDGQVKDRSSGGVGGTDKERDKADVAEYAYEYVPVPQRKKGRENIYYEMEMRQQPVQARMCGVGEKSDRRPVDPTPIIQLKVIDRNTDPSSPAGSEGKGKKRLRRPEGMSYMQNPYYFLFACLVPGETAPASPKNVDPPSAPHTADHPHPRSQTHEDELHLIEDGKTRFLTGTQVSSLYHLKDLDNTDAAFFVFPDLGVRKEGRYRLKLTLFEIVEQEIYYCTTTYTAPFSVYSAKKFPGMQKATDLSKSFAEQGLKIRVRKDPRKRTTKPKRRSSAQDSSASDADNPGFAPVSSGPVVPPHAKRPRHSVPPNPHPQGYNRPNHLHYTPPHPHVHSASHQQLFHGSSHHWTNHGGPLPGYQGFAPPPGVHHPQHAQHPQHMGPPPFPDLRDPRMTFPGYAGGSSRPGSSSSSVPGLFGRAAGPSPGEGGGMWDRSGGEGAEMGRPGSHQGRLQRPHRPMSSSGSGGGGSFHHPHSPGYAEPTQRPHTSSAHLGSHSSSGPRGARVHYSLGPSVGRERFPSPLERERDRAREMDRAHPSVLTPLSAPQQLRHGPQVPAPKSGMVGGHMSPLHAGVEGRRPSVLEDGIGGVGGGPPTPSSLSVGGSGRGEDGLGAGIRLAPLGIPPSPEAGLRRVSAVMSEGNEGERKDARAKERDGEQGRAKPEADGRRTEGEDGRKNRMGLGHLVD